MRIDFSGRAGIVTVASSGVSSGAGLTERR